MRLRRHGDKWGRNALGLIPLLEVLEHQLDFARDERDVGDEPFNSGLAEVCFERSQEFGLVFVEHLDHLLELVFAPGEWASVARVIGGAKVCGISRHSLPFNRETGVVLFGITN